VQVATVVSKPSINNVTRSVSTVVDVLEFHGSDFAPTAADNRLEFSPIITCPIVVVNTTYIACNPSGDLPVGALLATVYSFGGTWTRAAVAADALLPLFEVVPRPQITTSGLSIALGTTSLVLGGSGFDPQGNNIVELSLASVPVANLTITAASATELSVTFAALNASGALVARVNSFGGWSELTPIGLVGSGVANTPQQAQSPLDPSGVLSPGASAGIGIAVAVAALLLIALLLWLFVFRKRRNNRDIELAGAVEDIGDRLDSMFSIKSSDITLSTKLGEGRFAFFFFLPPSDPIKKI
jgi:hypothetical protein